MPSGNLFYSGSNAGYGSSTVGRTPGIWNLSNNHFTVVPGLADPTETETSMSVLLPPAQAQRYMIVGGGGVGNSLHSTARTAIVDLKAKHPHWAAGPSLPEPTRYPSVVITPDNNVIITGGSRYYRGEFNSDILTCHLYDPATNKLTALASPTVGRDYHSEALLLPGRTHHHARREPAVRERDRQLARVLPDGRSRSTRRRTSTTARGRRSPAARRR